MDLKKESVILSREKLSSKEGIFISIADSGTLNLRLKGNDQVLGIFTHMGNVNPVVDVVPLNDASMTLGRSPDNTLVIDGALISRSHSKVFLNSKGDIVYSNDARNPDNISELDYTRVAAPEDLIERHAQNTAAKRLIGTRMNDGQPQRGV